MGTDGRGGLHRTSSGSTAEGVLRLAEVPVFVVHAASRSSMLRMILVAIDSSEPAQSAGRFAVDLAAANKARVVFCHVSEDVDQGQESDGTAAARRYAEVAAVPSEIVRLGGKPAAAIVTSAQALHADLIAIGTHGRRGLGELLFGSVARGVIRASPMPVVVLRLPVRVVRTEATTHGCP
jgi:nucleotide-binding universal stress UspA family protein